MKIAVDFDGVICQRMGIPRKPSIENTVPVADSKKALEWLIREGHDPYILTNREQQEVYDWLDRWQFPPISVTNMKQPETVLYIDDRAVRFTNWQDVCKLIG